MTKMKMWSMLGVCTLLVVTAGISATVVDDFNRADSTTIGNGWTETAAGNGGSGGGTIPDASISSNVLGIARMGWGPNAYCTVSKTLDQEYSEVSLDMAIVSDTKGKYSGEARLLNSSGGYILVALWNGLVDSGKWQLGIAHSVNGAWSDWAYLSDPTNNPGWVSIDVKILDSTGSYTVTVVDRSSSSLIKSYSDTASDLAGKGFDKVTIKANYNSWSGGTANGSKANSVLADNIVAVPEPATMGLLLTGTAAGLLRRK